LKLLVLFLFILFAKETHAFTDFEFCTELVNQNHKEEDKLSFKSIAKILFKPSSIIEAHQIYSEVNTSKANIEGRKIVYVHLPEVEYDKNLLKSFRKSERKVIKLKLYRKLKKSKEVKDCLEKIDQDPNSFILIRDYIDQAINLEDELNKRKDYFGIKDLKTKLKSFKRKGWEIVFSKNIVQFLKDINLKKPKEILFLAHSDQNGKLYDAEKNIFPKNSFEHLLSYIEHFILFSCHAEKVIATHHLKEIFVKNTLSYPTLTNEFKDLFKDKTPLISIKAMMNLTYFKQDKNQYLEMCEVKISSSKKEKNLIITLNDVVIGSMHEEYEKALQVECLKIKDKNIVKIFQPSSAPKLKLDLNEVSLIKNNVESQLDIREFISQINNHHILTIGTNGGIP
jgi:hypothetical protein